MTQDEIIEMALREWRGGYQVRQAGLDRNYTDAFKAFAKLVAEKERDACALIADTYRKWDDTGMGIAVEIRARGQA